MCVCGGAAGEEVREERERGIPRGLGMEVIEVVARELSS